MLWKAGVRSNCAPIVFSLRHVIRSSPLPTISMSPAVCHWKRFRLFLDIQRSNQFIGPISHPHNASHSVLHYPPAMFNWWVYPDACLNTSVSVSVFACFCMSLSMPGMQSWVLLGARLCHWPCYVYIRKPLEGSKKGESLHRADAQMRAWLEQSRAQQSST